MRNFKNDRNGFTLIELVVVVVIIAIIAAIAIPKMSRGSAGAADSAVAQDLATMRSALELYQTEHGGAYPSSTSAATFLNQLTQYTDASGSAQATKDTTHIYGPYLKAVPPLPTRTSGSSCSRRLSGRPTKKPGCSRRRRRATRARPRGRGRRARSSRRRRRRESDRSRAAAA